ncbi:hypothetical protein SAMN04489797_1583 [Winogradskyella sediminis]|uniref:Uncharacterized protein n=1 Tax=Winogradskyella sediminis TaxID=1382466 RepID=A0A1H1S5E4_9FLAO|nr:hypothetical protein SAMN04489797_1583 [Winogradskyella sediminis]
MLFIVSTIANQILSLDTFPVLKIITGMVFVKKFYQAIPKLLYVKIYFFQEKIRLIFNIGLVTLTIAQTINNSIFVKLNKTYICSA